MVRCVICDDRIEDTFNTLLYDDCKVCYRCLNRFDIRNNRFIICGVKGVVLYYYNDFFKELLFRYKGKGDYCLKDVFLCRGLSAIKKKYKGYSVVLAPSNETLENKRGFCHLEEIFKLLDLPLIKCFRKECDWKQSDKDLRDRINIQNVIKIDKRMLNGVKKVLIVDDVMTSGSTIKAMISQMPANINKKVIVLSSNCRILGNEII